MTKRRLVFYSIAGTLLVVLSSAWLVKTVVRTEFSKPTELHLAAARNDIETVKTWIAKGRNLNVKYNEPGNIHEGSGLAGQTALMFAAENRQLGAVRALVEGGADIYLETWRPGREGHQYSAFDYAVRGGNPQIVKYLWERSDKQSFRKRTPINLGIAYQRLCDAQAPQTREPARELVVFLLENLADAKLASDALAYVSNRATCLEEIRFLLGRGLAPTPEALVSAASLGRAEIVWLYLEQGVDVNAVVDHRSVHPYRGITALIAAASAGRLKTVEVLLSAGADPNRPDGAGRTALIAAVADAGCTAVRAGCEERLEVMRALLRHGARADIRDREGKTALAYADRFSGDVYVAKKKAILTGLD